MPIIAIQGYKGSGKDTVALMLQYLLNSPKILHNYKLYKILNKLFINRKFKIVRYADKIKEMLSALLEVKVSKFENRYFKEQCYIDFTTLTQNYVNTGWEDFCTKILPDNKFSKEAKKLNANLTTDYVLSIRQILQYFGTEIMRYYFGDKLWILATLSNKTNIIISDQRFIVENHVTTNAGATIIHIIRPGCEKGTHVSELELETLYNNKSYNYLIENDGSLDDLFYKCKNIIKNGLYS